MKLVIFRYIHGTTGFGHFLESACYYSHFAIRLGWSIAVDLHHHQISKKFNSEVIPKTFVDVVRSANNITELSPFQGTTLIQFKKHISKHSSKISSELTVCVMSDLVSESFFWECNESLIKEVVQCIINDSPPVEVNTVIHFRLGDSLLLGSKKQTYEKHNRQLSNIVNKDWKLILQRCIDTVKQYTDAVLVVSDSERLLDSLREEFGDKIVSSNKPVHSLIKDTDMNGVINDSLLLFHAKRVICYSGYEWGSSLSRAMCRASGKTYEMHMLFPKNKKRGKKRLRTVDD